MLGAVAGSYSLGPNGGPIGAGVGLAAGLFLVMVLRAGVSLMPTVYEGDFATPAGPLRNRRGPLQRRRR